MDAIRRTDLERDTLALLFDKLAELVLMAQVTPPYSNFDDRPSKIDPLDPLLPFGVRPS